MPIREGRRLRMALVAHTPNWAFANIARNITQVLADDVEVVTLYLQDLTPRTLMLQLYVLDPAPFDHVHFLARVPFLNIFKSDASLAHIVRRVGWGPGQPDDSVAAERIMRFASRVRSTTTTMGIYDHLFLSDEEMRLYDRSYQFADGYTTSSLILAREYQSRLGVEPLAITRDGVDSSLFQPRSLERFTDCYRPLVVGWSGNSKWPDQGDADPKGFRTILTPALDSLRERGAPIATLFADRATHWAPHEEMPDYYAKIDVLICASETEGTPNPVLEAMACGVPVISTRVGIVPEALGPLQRSFIIDRTVEAFASTIERLANDRELLATLSAENLRSIRGWEWADHAADWRRLIDAGASARANHRAG